MLKKCFFFLFDEFLDYFIENKGFQKSIEQNDGIQNVRV